nr:ABC transporter permease [Actinomycetota bacterium]
MDLIAYWFVATFRRRWRSYLGVALLLGITGGLSLAAIAGARRTQSALPRFFDAIDASTMSASVGAYDPSFEAAVAALPQVRRSTTDLAFNVAPLIDDEPNFDQGFDALSSLDGRYLRQDRFTPTQGRRPDPHRIDEVAFNELAAERFGYRVGQRIELGTYADEQLEDPDFFTQPTPPELRMTATVVGIGLFGDEVVQDEADRTGRLLLSQAYAEEAEPYASYSWQGLVLARGDGDVDAVKQQYLGLLPPEGLAIFHVASVDEFHGLQAIRPLSLALGAFGVIAGVAGLVLVAQTLTRHLRHARREGDVLRALGATPTLSAAASLVGPLVAIVAGTVLAVFLAVAFSPAMPIGPVRRVEVSKGVDVDVIVLGLGALVLLAGMTMVMAIVAWQEARQAVERRRPAPVRSSSVGSWAAAAGMSPAGVAGLRSAFEPGQDATAVPVRSVMAGAAMAIMALVSALTFGTSLQSLLAQPRLFGWDWDATVLDTGGYGDISVEKASAALEYDGHVASWSGVYFTSDAVDGRNLPLLAMEPGSEVFPPLLQGRPTHNPNEVVLGSRTAAELGKQPGDTVVLGDGTQSHELEVVGIATLPTIGAIGAAYTSLGVGAIVA